MSKCCDFKQTRTFGRSNHEFREGSRFRLSYHCCRFLVVLFCPRECRCHCCCSCHVGLKRIAVASQAKFRILCVCTFFASSIACTLCRVKGSMCCDACLSFVSCCVIWCGVCVHVVRVHVVCLCVCVCVCPVLCVGSNG